MENCECVIAAGNQICSWLFASLLVAACFPLHKGNMFSNARYINPFFSLKILMEQKVNIYFFLRFSFQNSLGCSLTIHSTFRVYRNTCIYKEQQCVPFTEGTTLINIKITQQRLQTFKRMVDMSSTTKTMGDVRSVQS